MITLPIDPELPFIVSTFKKHKNLILKASPGSGKTTRLPAALLKNGFKKIVVLVPKRLAAISAADRIASENNWELGNQVGYHVRFEALFKKDTELIFMTEGVFIKKSADEKFWNSVEVLIFDEFHERSSLVDIALGLALEKQILDAPLKLIIMSATLNSKALETYLTESAVVDIKAVPHPLKIIHTARPQRLNCDPEFYNNLVQTTSEAFGSSEKDVLIFLPGFGEMRKAATALNKKLSHVPVEILHGSLKISEQREILRVQNYRRIILATDIAESSLTLPSVDCVIDSGLKKNSTLEPKVGFSQLSLQRISLFSAEQRSGRAARLGPGTCYRMWHPSDELSMPPQIKPEVLNSDLLEEILILKSCGVGLISGFSWLDKPPKKAVDQAIKKLCSWNLLDPAEKITALGLQIQNLPLNIDRALLFTELCQKGFQNEASQFLARLETLDFSKIFAESDPNADDLERVLQTSLTAEGLKIKSQLEGLRIFHPSVVSGSPKSTDFRKPLIQSFFTLFPHKISQKKSESDAVSSLGRGLTLKPGLQARHFDYQILLAGHNFSDRTEIHFAVGFSKSEFLDFSSTSIQLKTEYIVDFERRQVFKIQSKKVGRFIISESARAGLTPFEEAKAWPLITSQDGASILNAHTDFQRFKDKIIFLNKKLGLVFAMDDELTQKVFSDLGDSVQTLSHFVNYPLLDLLILHLPDNLKEILTDLPDFLILPSSRKVTVDYVSENAPMISAKIQDFYGMKEHPTILQSKLPLTLQLLAPSLRPTQITQNLKLFWEKSYFEIRKELKARYPKQQWPDNPADYVLEKKK